MQERRSKPRRCLGSVQWIDEKFLVDSQSTDRTGEIAQKFGARIVQFNYGGGWPKKKNWALENLPFSHNWVLILDADECLPSEAEEEIRKIVNNPNEKHSGYWINRRYYFLGKPLKHAYFPKWNLRLFKHQKGRYEKITDLNTDSGDNEVHEHVLVNGSTGKLKSIMDHYAFPTIDSFVEKHNRYSNWEAVVEAQRKMADLLYNLALLRVKTTTKVFASFHFAPPFGFCMFTCIERYS